MPVLFDFSKFAKDVKPSDRGAGILWTAGVQAPAANRPKIPRATKPELKALLQTEPANSKVRDKKNWTKEGVPRTEAAAKALKQVSVPIAKLIATQSSVEPYYVDRYQTGFKKHGIPTELKSRPVVWKFNNEYYLVNGHHRVVAAALNGASKMPVNVLGVRSKTGKDSAWDGGSYLHEVG